VGGRARLQQVVDEALADDVERDVAAARRPDVADRVQQLGDVEVRVGAQRIDRETGRGNRPVAVDERGVAEGHLTEDRDVEQVKAPWGRSRDGGVACAAAASRRSRIETATDAAPSR